MLQAIKELGEEKLRWEGKELGEISKDILSTVIQDPNETGNYPYVLVIVLRREGLPNFFHRERQFVYDRIQVEGTDKSKIHRYLYRRGSSMGANRSPTALITEIPKTFQRKLRAWFQKFGSKDPLFANLKEALERDKDRILQDLQGEWGDIASSLKRQQSGVLTIAIEDNGGLGYPGDFPEFRDLLGEEIRGKYGKVLRADHTCSVCGERKAEVYGEALTEVFKFYNLDKPGYIAGGFRREEAWKNFPICMDCILKIEEGRKFLSEHLTYRMGGQRYWLIPKLLKGVPQAHEVITAFFQIATHPEDVLKSRRLEQISEDENEILSELGELQDVLTYNFFFFELQKGSSIPREITLLVEDILPSRLSQIFQAKMKTDACDLLHNVKVKKAQYENIGFRFDAFKRFTPSSKAFLEIVDRCFRGFSIDGDLVLSWIIGRIRQDFANEGYLKPIVLRGLSALLFFRELGVLKQPEHQVKGGATMTELSAAAEGFFSKYGETIPLPAHKALFLLGTLTQKLLNIQYRDRRSAPFRKNLKGLKMREEDFQGLLPKIQNKLEEYGKNYYKDLETLISEYFLLAGRDWGLSTDEMNFYFVLGMNLVDNVFEALKIQPEEEEV